MALARTLRIAGPRPAFTLVELLTVIIIIGILMAILVPAVMSAKVKALDSRIGLEITQLDSGLKAFKEKNGSYPPTTWAGAPNAQRIIAQLRRSFPRATFSGTALTFRDDVLAMTDNDSSTNPSTGGTYPACGASATPVTPGYDGGTGLNVNNIDPPEAIVLWLGGLPAQHDDVADPTVWEGSTKVTGFNLTPADPLRPRTPAGGQRSTSLFDFVPTRLRDVDTDGWLEYYPEGQERPYFYFDSVSYPTFASPSPYAAIPELAGARPYLDGTNTAAFMNQGTFQILSAGQDDDYGMDSAAKQFPLSSNNSSQLDLDNLSNFTRGRLEDAQ